MLQSTVSRPGSLVSSTHLRLTTRFLLLSDSCGFVDVGRSLWPENGSAVYIAAGPRQRSHSLVRVPWDSPNLEGQVPVFISPRHRVAQLYPQALGSLLVASYDSQAYDGGIRTRFRAGD
jgi:hypothetical protein